jgi:hypothetical protein
MGSSIASVVNDLLAQLSTQSRLRAGVWVVVALSWVYALLLASDWTQARVAELEATRDEVRALEPVTRSAAQWAGREREVAEAMGRIRALSWPGTERGLIEATVQDWLRAATAKAGLPLREIRIISDQASPQSLRAAPSGRPSALSQGSPEPIRLRLVVEFRRLEATAFLVELARHEPLISVERLVIRTQTQPPVMESELRVLGLEGKHAW